MSDLKPIDKFFLNWIKANLSKFVWSGESGHSWDVEEVIGFMGWPSEQDGIDPYLEYIQHALNDHAGDLGIPLPDEVIAYHVSLWCDNTVPINHKLITDRARILDIWYKSEYDDATKSEFMYMWDLVATVARGELAENLGDRNEVLEHFDAPQVDDKSKFYMFGVNGEVYHIVSGDSLIGVMNGEGVVKVFDGDGNKLNVNTDRITNAIMQHAKISKPITDINELASIVGNDLARLIVGDDGFSIMDLPD